MRTSSDLPRLLFGRRGAAKARGWIEQADGRAESPLETRARLRCADGGVPPDELQAVIADASGRVLARVDLLWRAARLIGEADGGEVHDRPDARVPRPRTPERPGQRRLPHHPLHLARHPGPAPHPPYRPPRPRAGRSCDRAG